MHFYSVPVLVKKQEVIFDAQTAFIICLWMRTTWAADEEHLFA